MVFYLLKREEILKAALVLSLISPLVLVPGASLMVGGSFWNALLFVVFFSAARFRLDQRTSRFEVALPISGRQIFLVRTLGMLAVVWLPIITAASCLLLAKHDAGGLMGQLARGGAVLTLAALLPLSVRLREAALPGLMAVSLPLGVVAIGVATWFFLPPWLHLLCFGAMDVAILTRALLMVPAGFQTSPMEAVEARRALFGRTNIDTPPWWPILRAAKPWLIVVLLACGVFTAGMLQVKLEFLLIVFQAGLHSRNGTRWLRAFPISYRVMLWLTLATTVVPFLVGSAVGTWICRPPFPLYVKPLIGGGGPRVDRDFLMGGTNVPLEFWRYAPAGRAPVVRAPWGESVEPPSISILGLRFYNPYACTRHNSDRFREWQFGNATLALEGRRMASSGYFESWSKTKNWTFPERNRVEILTFATLLFGLLAGVYVRELSLWHGLKRTTLFARYLSIYLLLPFFAWQALDIYSAIRNQTAIVAPLFAMLCHRASAILPHSLLALVAIVVAPSFILYLLVERQFARAEMTGPLMPSFASRCRGLEPR